MAAAILGSSTLVPSSHSSGVSCQARLGQEAVHRFRVYSRQKGLMGQSLPQQRPLCNTPKAWFPSLRITSASAQEFAEREASKFRDDLAEELKKYENLADERGRIAETCAKVLKDYLQTWSGVFAPPQPVDEMKKALQEQGLPFEKPVCCAIWWVRAYLRKDWEQYKLGN